MCVHQWNMQGLIIIVAIVNKTCGCVPDLTNQNFSSVIPGHMSVPICACAIMFVHYYMCYQLFTAGWNQHLSSCRSSSVRYNTHSLLLESIILLGICRYCSSSSSAGLA